MKLTRPSAFRKYCASVVAVALLLQPLGAYAAPTKLSEIPLQGIDLTKPNIMYTMDDSGSMAVPTLPDYLLDASAFFACRNGAGAAAFCTAAGFFALEGRPPYASSSVNKIYYDPSITYRVGKMADPSKDLPFEDTRPGTWTRVYKDGFAGYPGPNLGGTIDLTTEYPDEVYCWKPDAFDGTAPSAADLATANTNGSVCRYNGKAYKAFSIGSVTTAAVAAGYNYPNAATGTCSNSDTGKCVFDQRVQVTGSPYYYTISSVQFCPTPDAKGWGIASSACGSRWTPTNRYVSYGGGGFDPAAFFRVDIDPTDKKQMDNFAIWYAFAHTRILAMKTAGGIAFSSLGNDPARVESRVGFNTLNTFKANFLNIQDFKEPYKTAWFTNFYSAIPTGVTPSLDAIWRVGEYFSNRGAAAGLPGAVDPLDPVTGKCQLNFHLMSTDGYWNQTGLTPYVDRIGNQDLLVPATLPGPVPGFVPGAPFPPPYREGSSSANSTMSDYAMQYWVNDIRPDLDNRVKDPVAPWQHVTFYGLSIGAEGTLDSNLRTPSGDGPPASIVSGLSEWPRPANNTATAIDDLWHAAVNSRGKYLNAQNAEELARAMVKAVGDFTAQPPGTGTGVGIAGAQITATKKYGYLTSYAPIDWSGDVRKYALDPATGAIPVDKDGIPLKLPLWSAATQLDAQAAGTGWKLNRRIVTINDASNAVVGFRLANLSTAQQASLNAGWSIVTPTPTALDVLNYLRGDNSNVGDGTANFRARTHILGDIVYSGAVPVGAPGQPYDDAGNPGYTDFASSKSSRTPMVYVGGNDGMVHALDDSVTADAGKETWAFIPSVLFSNGDPNVTKFDPKSKSSIAFQLGALTYRRGGIPLFSHKFRANVTPRVWDIDFANTNTNKPPKTGNDWRTILVGGLGAGGRSVYALDVTTPVLATESEGDIASSGRVLWEFTDEHLGYVFDAPTLVKTQRYGWVVLVTSGYNNEDGKGRLFVINPKDGTLLKTLSTGVGSDDDPSGLSTIRAYTPSRKDPYVLQAYGGDLKGNVWRFDLSDPDEDKWRVDLIAKLTDASGKAQPITTGVRIEIDQNNNVDRYLFVGTGKLLHQDDLKDATVTNTIYVIRDGTRTAAEPAPKTPYSRKDLNAVDGSSTGGFSGAATGRGWYQDASDPKEKIGTDVFADVQTVVYSFAKPSSDPCESALTSTLFARELNTGNSVIQSAGGAVVPSIADIGAIAGVALIQGLAGTGSSASGDVRVQVTTMKGQVFSFGVNLAGGTASKHRVSWRLLNRE